MIKLTNINEHGVQASLIHWFRCKYPEHTHLFFAIPNGGRRDKATAARLKKEGVVAGIPDLMLAMPRPPFHGLFLELKTATGSVSRSQKAVAETLRAQNYQVVVAYGLDDAIETIETYLETPRTHPPRAVGGYAAGDAGAHQATRRDVWPYAPQKLRD